MDDGYGQQMYKTVEKYADNQRKNSIPNKNAMACSKFGRKYFFLQFWTGNTYVNAWMKNENLSTVFSNMDYAQPTLTDFDF